ncbi:MAG: hypothetical protein H6Q65_1272, partial [Firmicutes bacterium]|nr:hypothetical protein [Bacillota bacterium]
LTDYINHGTARHVKEKAKSLGIPAVFAKRSWRSLEEELTKFTVPEGRGKDFHFSPIIPMV